MKRDAVKLYTMRKIVESATIDFDFLWREAAERDRDVKTKEEPLPGIVC